MNDSLSGHVSVRNIEIKVTRQGNQGLVTVRGPRGGVWAQWTSSVNALRGLARQLNRVADEIAPVPKHKCPPPPNPVPSKIMHILLPGKVVALCRGGNDKPFASVGGVCSACLGNLTTEVERKNDQRTR